MVDRRRDGLSTTASTRPDTRRRVDASPLAGPSPEVEPCRVGNGELTASTPLPLAVALPPALPLAPAAALDAAFTELRRGGGN